MRELIHLLLLFIFPIVLSIVALYFNNNIHVKIGKSGYITKKSLESAETWIYAQIIAPRLILKVAGVCILLNMLISLVMVIADYEYKMIMETCNLVGFLFVFLPFFLVDKKLEDFQKKELFEEKNNQDREKWLKLVTILITEKQLSKIDATINNKSMREDLFEKYEIK